MTTTNTEVLPLYQEMAAQLDQALALARAARWDELAMLQEAIALTRGRMQALPASTLANLPPAQLEQLHDLAARMLEQHQASAALVQPQWQELQQQLASVTMRQRVDQAYGQDAPKPS